MTDLHSIQREICRVYFLVLCCFRWCVQVVLCTFVSDFSPELCNQSVQACSVGCIFNCCVTVQGGAGASAVKCSGTGVLQSVRVIHLSRDTYFWFEVHSGKQGAVAHGSPNVAAHSMTQPSAARVSDHQSGTTLPVLPQKLSVGIGDTAFPLAVDSIAQRAKAWNVVRHANLVLP